MESEIKFELIIYYTCVLIFILFSCACIKWIDNDIVWAHHNNAGAIMTYMYITRHDCARIIFPIYFPLDY